MPPTTLFQVLLSISADTFFTLPDSDLAFSAVVERIRFTTLVPEPGGSVLATAGIALAGCRRTA